MRYDRNKMLKEFLSCGDMVNKTGMTAEELAGIDFSVKTNNEIIESLKVLVMNYCNDETPTVILRKINMQIDLLTKNSME